MASALQIITPDTVRKIRRVQALTVVWMTIETALSLLAAWRAHSPALAAFGGDSAIELLSATVVLWRFRSGTAQPNAERRAARLAGVLLFALALYVVALSATSLLGYSQPQPSLLGIAILAAAALIMPRLAKEKRRLSAIARSETLNADATQSAVCAYLSVIALAGLAINAIWRLTWPDPLAALALVPLIIWEGWETVRGKACCCR